MKVTSQKKKKETKLTIDLSKTFLSTLLNSLFSLNSLVDRKFLNKVNSFFKLLDLSEYETNKEKAKFIEWIELYLKNYFGKNIKNVEHIYENIIVSTKYQDELVEYTNSDLATESSNEDIYWLDNFITSRLKWAFIYKNAKKLKDLLTKLEYNDFDNFEDVVEDILDNVSDLYYKNQLVRIKNEDEKFDFSVKNQLEFKTSIENAYKNITNPKNTIKTGIKKLNKILNGGFQSGRSYCFLTLPGKWKSGLLLNSCMWALKYNQDIVCNDPTRIPTVVYLSCENSRDETIERMTSYLSNEMSGVDLRNLKLKELFNKFLKSDVFSKQNKMDFVFWYRRSKTINTNDIEGMMLELENTPIVNEETGEHLFREIVYIAIDYLGRLKPIESEKSGLYESTGEISDNICNLGKIRGIPMVTAHQLNRDADKRIELSEKEKLKGLKLGLQHVAESRAIINNFDYVIIQYPEDECIIDNTRYLLFNVLKKRGRDITDKDYFYQPFETDMKLIEDIDLPKSYSIVDLKSFITDDDLETSSKNLRKERRKNLENVKKLVDSDKDENISLKEEIDNDDDF